MPLQGFVWGGRRQTPQPRTRSEAVLLWVMQGAMKLGFPRSSHRLGPGCLYFIPAGTAFAALPLVDCAGHALLIAPHLTRELPQPFPTGPVGGRIGDGEAGLWHLLRELEAEAQRGTDAASKAIDCHLSLLALRLGRMAPTARPAQRPRQDLPDLPLAERFLALLGSRLGDGSTVADLAHDLGVTTAELDTACGHKFGKRAVEVMNDQRLRRAVRLLRDTPESPADIANRLGYTSLAHLSRAFIAATGRLPEQFRTSR